MESREIGLAKKAMFSALEGANLGRAVLNDSRERRQIEDYIAKVEALNPTPLPVQSELLNGEWKLVYTDSPEILGTQRPFDWLRPTDEIYQAVSLPTGTIENREIIIVPVLGELVNRVRARAWLEPPRRVRVKFEEFQFGPFRFNAPDRGSRAYLDVTYLDQHLRISRGNKQHIFVLTKEKSQLNMAEGQKLNK